MLKADIFKAFDSLHHASTVAALEDSSVPRRIGHAFLRALLSRRVHILAAGSSAEDIPVRYGGVQGAVETPTIFDLLFIFAFQHLPEKWRREGLGYTDDDFHCSLCIWADDFIVVASSQAALLTMMWDIENALRQIHLRLAPAKCAYAFFSQGVEFPPPLRTERMVLSPSRSLVVLGHLLSVDPDEGPRNSISAAWRLWWSRDRAYLNCRLSARARADYWRATVLASPLRGCQCWYLRKNVAYEI